MTILWQAVVFSLYISAYLPFEPFLSQLQIFHLFTTVVPIIFDNASYYALVNNISLYEILVKAMEYMPSFERKNPSVFHVC